VLSLTVADVSGAMLDRYRTLASLVGMMIEAKAGYSDLYAQTQRSQEMALQAELVWAFLPPRTFATDRVLVSVSLEPAYEAGGDAFGGARGCHRRERRRDHLVLRVSRSSRESSAFAAHFLLAGRQ
jgi:hypothetical protein